MASSKPAEGERVMPDRDRAKTIRALFAAYLANDWQVIEDSLTDISAA
jgi:hypothetical protein